MTFQKPCRKQSPPANYAAESCVLITHSVSLAQQGIDKLKKEQLKH